MTRIRVIAMVSAVVGAMLFGGAMFSVADADGDRIICSGAVCVVHDPNGPGATIVPNVETAAPTATPDAEADVVVCSMVDGCDVTVVFMTAEGEVAKTMTIRLVDKVELEPLP